MLTLLSPAKALDFTTPVVRKAHSQPRLLDQAAALAEVMKEKSVSELARLSHISDELAALNAERWAAFAVPFPDGAARVAVLAFNGDTYQGLAARRRFDARDYTEAQKSLRILSGLYGVLRPLDLMLAYRLEMGTRLATSRGETLYQWWGEQITDLLNEDVAAAPGAKVVVNLASGEYAAAVNPARLDATWITPRFLDADARGQRRVISFFAKRARGEMAAWIVKSRLRSPRALSEFQAAGYRYDKRSSTPAEPVFVRAFTDRMLVESR